MAASRASAWTAWTMAISPIPLPIEMFWRKISRTMSGGTAATIAAGKSGERLLQDRGERFRRNPRGILDGEMEIERRRRPS